IILEEKQIMSGFEEKLGHLSQLLERSRIDEYTSMIRRPWRFFFFSFIAGLVRGLGFAIGMTIIFAILVYFLTKVLAGIINMPVIGSYVGELVKYVEQYINQAPAIK
ncbi:MAG: hypothetical protein KKH83_05835, partial [Candidatus Margulisbacteria bacterium]|nr:hypothetical protein [Candidatus Margulisiibacteriota bacterium]